MLQGGQTLTVMLTVLTQLCGQRAEEVKMGATLFNKHGEEGTVIINLLAIIIESMSKSREFMDTVLTKNMETKMKIGLKVGKSNRLFFMNNVRIELIGYMLPFVGISLFVNADLVYGQLSS